MHRFVLSSAITCLIWFANCSPAYCNLNIASRQSSLFVSYSAGDLQGGNANSQSGINTNLSVALIGGESYQDPISPFPSFGSASYNLEQTYSPQAGGFQFEGTSFASVYAERDFGFIDASNFIEIKFDLSKLTEFHLSTILASDLISSNAYLSIQKIMGNQTVEIFGAANTFEMEQDLSLDAGEYVMISGVQVSTSFDFSSGNGYFKASLVSAVPEPSAMTYLFLGATSYYLRARFARSKLGRG